MNLDTVIFNFKEMYESLNSRKTWHLEIIKFNLIKTIITIKL